VTRLLPGLDGAPAPLCMAQPRNGDQAVPIALPSPAFPTVSRDGRFLLVTSPDPSRPFKFSHDVFMVDLSTMTHVRAVHFVDKYRLCGVLLTNDLGNVECSGRFTRICLMFADSNTSPPNGAKYYRVVRRN
jgi:hypothetical protein